MADFPVFDIDPRIFEKPTLEEGGFGGVLSNAIAKRLARAKMQEAEKEAPYAGLAKLASILSQSAYANAVTPQFQAKLLGIPGAIANLKTPQSTLNNLEKYGQTGSTGNVMQDYINRELLKIAQGNQPTEPGFLGTIGKGIKNIFMGGNQEQPMASAEAPIVTGYNEGTPNQPQTQRFAPVNATQPNPSGRSPESLAYSTNQASANRTVSKGTEQGKKEGEQQAAYGEQAESITGQQKSLKTLNRVFQDPEIEKISDVPFASQKSIQWYKQTGTPSQKYKLGLMDSAMNTYITSSLKMFGSRATDTDLNFIKNDLKPSSDDTMDVRKGKWIALQEYTEAKAQQIKLADKFMSQGMSKTEAEFKAADMVDTDAIRDNAYKAIYPEKVNANVKNEASEKGYTRTMWTPPDPVTGKRRKALVHEEDVKNALKEGWKDA